MELLNMDVCEMTGLDYACTCGRRHRVSINNIIIGNGAIEQLATTLSDFKGKKVFIVEDINTHEAAGALVESRLMDDFKLAVTVFEDKQLVPDEKAVGRLLIELPADAALILGVGSGTINDICRFLSHKTHIPYAIVCTAPSMDGYASVVSPLVVNGVKTTYDAVYPYAIIADTEILKKAPVNMLHAGLGDILGKYTALADWQIARIIKDEYFCSSIEKLIQKAIGECAEASAAMSFREEAAIRNITSVLILSGLAIGMTGSSRPASGEEHHLSHCWEAFYMNEGIEIKWLHGNNVGVGTGIVLEAYKYLGRLDIDRVYESGKFRFMDKERWINSLRAVYGKNAGHIAESKQDYIAFDSSERERNMDRIRACWTDIKEICDFYIPEPEALRSMLKNMGAVWHPEELGIDRTLFIRSFIAAKDIRKRYGVFQLLEDIGMLEAAAEAEADIYYGK